MRPADLRARIAPEFRHYAGSESVPHRAAASQDPREQADYFAAELLDDANGSTRYMVVREQKIDRAVREAARTGRAFAAAHLGVTAPSMSFFRPEGAAGTGYRKRHGRADWPSFRGRAGVVGIAMATLGSIGVRADISPLLAVEAAAHETFHVARPGRPELEAEEYGAYAAAVLTASGRVARVFRDDDPFERAGDWDVRVTAAGRVLWLLGSRWTTPYVSCPVDRERRT